jgi:hypothetical protein
MMMVDDEERMPVVNRQLEVLFGYGPDDLVGQPVEIRLPEGLREAHRAHRAEFAAERWTRTAATSSWPSHRSNIKPEFTEAEFRALMDELAPGESLSYTTVHRGNDGTDFPVEAILQRPADSADGPGWMVSMARAVPVLAERPAPVVENLGDPIRELRASLFELNFTSTAESLRTTLFSLCDDAKATLGFAPVIRFDGLIDTIANTTGGRLPAVLREALSYVARHAQATGVEVTITVGPDLTLRVVDNGTGEQANALRPGGNVLNNMSTRATKLGGTYTLTATVPSGTMLNWRVPLEHP